MMPSSPCAFAASRNAEPLADDVVRVADAPVVRAQDATQQPLAALQRDPSSDRPSR